MKQYNAIWNKNAPPQHYKSVFPQKVLNLLKERGAKKILDLGSGDGSNILRQIKKWDLTYHQSPLGLRLVA